MRRLQLRPAALLASAVLLGAAAAYADHHEELPTLKGDPIHGRSLFSERCGEEAARATLLSSEMSAFEDVELHRRFSSGSCVDSARTFDTSDIDYLDAWDMVAFVRTRHLGIEDFFPQAGRYIEKVYTIDDFGQGRIRKALGRIDGGLEHRVFTFFDFEGEEGNLRKVPNDDFIALDDLNKEDKSGYLVFVPFQTGNVRTEVGISMDPSGVIRKVRVHGTVEGADQINRQLAAFEGLGKLGQSQPFSLPRARRDAQALVKPLFRSYVYGAEAITMYVRDERERTFGE
jgi:hypothetical protein